MSQPITTIRLSTTTSSNDYLRQLTQASAPPFCTDPTAPLIVTAEEQTAGRGQRGNTWVSAHSQNLLFSIRICPHALEAKHAFVVSEAIALSIRGALMEHLAGSHAELKVKWPNDIYADRRKVAGILIENSLRGSQVGSSVVGCGVNVNQVEWPPMPAGPVPVSLSMLCGHSVEREQVLVSIVTRFMAYIDQINAANYNPIHGQYRACLYHGSGEHRFRDLREGAPAGAIFTGAIDHIGADGQLHVRTAAGTVHTFAFKEIAFLHD